MTTSMTMTTAPRAATASFSAPLVLEPPRHCGLSTIALIQGRHLIGSASGCGIRLQADGVQDRHAMILVGESRTVVKAIDPRTWINDGPVTEMALRHGDRLSIGPLTFRVRQATHDEICAFAEAPTPELQATRTEPPVAPISIAATATSDTGIASASTGSAVGSGMRPDNPAPKNEQELTQRSMPVGSQTTRAAADTFDESASPAARLSSRLDEIQQRLADLQQISELRCLNPTGAQHVADVSPNALRSRTDPVQSHPESPTGRVASTVDASSKESELQARNEELRRRADDIALQTVQLQTRMSEVTAREAQVQLREQSQAREVERLADAAETARQKLDEEHRRLSAQWREWDEKYQRMTGELTRQCDEIERQRVELRTEAEQLSALRFELNRLQSEHDQERRTSTMERARLEGELAEFQKLRTQFELERRQHTIFLEEREAQLAAERQTVIHDREALAANRQDLQRERAILTEERRLHSQQLEQQRDARQQVQATAESDPFSRSVEQWDLNSSQTILDQESRPLLADSTICQQPVSWRPVAAQYSEIEPPRTQLPATETDWNSFLTSSPSYFAKSESASTPGTLFDASSIQNHSMAQGDHPGHLLPWESSHELPHAPVTSATASPDGRDPWKSPFTSPGSDVSQSLDGGHPSLEIKSPEAVLVQDPWESIQAGTDWAVPGIWPMLPAGEAPMAESSGDNVSETLAAVNRQFGMPVNGAFEIEQPAPLQTGFSGFPGVDAQGSEPAPERYADPHTSPDNEPSPTSPHVAWWTEGPREPTSAAPVIAEERPGTWAINTTKRETVDETGSLAGAPKTESTAADPVTALRSQLAKMFDLPADNTSRRDPVSSHVETAHDAGYEQSSPAEADPESSAPEPRDDRVKSGLLMPTAIPDFQTSYRSDAASQTESSHQEVGVEDSVDAFMARLLARSRSDADAPLEQEPQSRPNSAAPLPASHRDSGHDVPAVEQPEDRSHLLAEPKHKQDKQAVRENLQSFRQVAHMSARSALARHSLRQLRNATIVKGVLLGASLIAATSFLMEPLYDRPIEVWKVSGCCLAALLAGVGFTRSWTQLRRPVKKPAPRAPSAPPTESTANANCEQQTSSGEEGHAKLEIDPSSSGQLPLPISSDV